MVAVPLHGDAIEPMDADLADPGDEVARGPVVAGQRAFGDVGASVAERCHPRVVDAAGAGGAGGASRTRGARTRRRHPACCTGSWAWRTARRGPEAAKAVGLDAAGRGGHGLADTAEHRAVDRAAHRRVEADAAHAQRVGARGHGTDIDGGADEEHPDDRRAKLVRLTPAGRRLATQVDAASRAHHARLLEALGPRAGALVRALQELERAMRSLPDSSTELP